MRNRIVGQDLAEITAEDLPWERLQGARVLVTGARGILASYMVETLLYLNETRRMGIRILAAQRNRKKAQARFAHAVACPALTLLQPGCLCTIFHRWFARLYHPCSRAVKP